MMDSSKDELKKMGYSEKEISKKMQERKAIENIAEEFLEAVKAQHCPYCSVKKQGHSLRCHIQSCSQRNETIARQK